MHQPNHARSLAVITFFASVLLPVSALGKTGDRDEPVKVWSKSTSAFGGANTKSTLDGQVKIVQGSLTATGDHADLYAGAGSEIVRVVISGARAHIEQLDDKGQLMRADARCIDYNLTTGIAILTGESAVEKSALGSATGSKIIYNVDDGSFSATGTDTEPVHMVIQPKRGNKNL